MARGLFHATDYRPFDCRYGVRRRTLMLPFPYAKLIHEKLSTILTFAYSHAPLEKMLDTKFKGEWKFLRKTIYGVGAERAILACIELATLMRLLDDAEKISDYLKQNPKPNRGSFGKVFKSAGAEEPLYLRDVTNKIIHAKDWKWDLDVPEQPKLICISDEPKRWKVAAIEIQKLAAFCGNLGH